MTGALAFYFWPKTQVQADCLVWLGATTRGGYGKLDYNGKTYLAHRLYYELIHKKPCPKRLVKSGDLCDDKLCVKHWKAT